MQTDPLTIGVDVAKAELVIGCLGKQAVHTLPNEAAAIKSWLQTVPKGSIVAMESTGTYHQLLARLAHAAGMHVYVLNAQALYFYAKGLGMRAKTDRVDCGVITRYVAEHYQQLHEWMPAAALHTEVDELIRRRAVVVGKRIAVRQALQGCKCMASALKDVERAFDRLLKTLDTKIQALIKTDPELGAAQKRIATVVGFGPLGSALLATLLARVPLASADALVAYSGIDPKPVDSGKRQGRRRLSKHGAAYLRRQWYLAGFTAAHTKALKPVYQALMARGLKTTEAILILGRKLLRAAYAVWKTGQPFASRDSSARRKPLEFEHRTCVDALRRRDRPFRRLPLDAGPHHAPPAATVKRCVPCSGPGDARLARTRRRTRMGPCPTRRHKGGGAGAVLAWSRALFRAGGQSQRRTGARPGPARSSLDPQRKDGRSEHAANRSGSHAREFDEEP